jgi:hypothetical protein
MALSTLQKRTPVPRVRALVKRAFPDRRDWYSHGYHLENSSEKRPGVNTSPFSGVSRSPDMGTPAAVIASASEAISALAGRRLPRRLRRLAMTTARVLDLRHSPPFQAAVTGQCSNSPPQIVTDL